MSWRAVTVHGTIRPGTELGIFEDGWGPDVPVRPLPSGVALTIEFPNNTRAKVEVIEVTESGVIIQTSDQAKWRMVEVGAKGLRFPPPDTAGAPTTYWVIRFY